jgi:hypothetical protein
VIISSRRTALLNPSNPPSAPSPHAEPVPPQRHRGQGIDLVRKLPVIVDRNVEAIEVDTGVFADQRQQLFGADVGLGLPSGAHSPDHFVNVGSADEHRTAASRAIAKDDAGMGVHAQTLLHQSCGGRSTGYAWAAGSEDGQSLQGAVLKPDRSWCTHETTV